MTKPPSKRPSRPRTKPSTIELKAQKAPSAETDASPKGPVTDSEAPFSGASAMKSDQEKTAGKSAGSTPSKDTSSPLSDEKVTGAHASAPVKVTPQSETMSDHERTEHQREALAEDARAAADPSVPPIGPGAGSRTMMSFASGIIGGLLALAIMAALYYGGWLPNADGGGDPRVEALSGDLEALRTEIARLEAASTASAGDANMIQALSSRLDELEMAGSGEDFAQLTGQVQTLEGAANERNMALGEMSQRLEDLAASVSGVEESVARTDQTLTAMEQRLADIEEANTVQRENDVSAAQAVALSGMQAAIDRGGSFEEELSIYESVASDAAKVEEFRPFAKEGVPSRAALAKAFPETADRILAAGAANADDDSIAGKLFSSARSLVQVRPTGPTEGEGSGAVVARMEEALTNGDLAKTVREWETLSDSEQEVSKDFIDDVRARMAVDGLLSKAIERAMPSSESKS